MIAACAVFTSAPCIIAICAVAVVALHAADLDFGNFRELVGEDIEEARACLDAAQFRRRIQNFSAAENTPPLLHDGADFVLLQAKRLQRALHLAEVRFFGRFARALVRRVRNVQEVPPRDRPGILLAQVRQHLIDVLAEHRVDGEQVNLLRPQILPLPVEQVRNPLQEHRRLAAARDSVDQKNRHILAPDDRILLLLDGRRDRLHLVRPAAGQRLQKHRILDRHLRVKEREQPVLLQIVLPAQLQIHVDAVPVHHVECLAVLLIVIRLRDGRPPVDHQMLIGVLRDAGAADVVVLGRLLRVKLQLHPGKIRRLAQSFDPAQLLLRRVLLDIVLIDRVAHGLKLDVRLHRIRIAVKIQRQIAADILLLLGRFLVDRFDLLFQRSLHRAQLAMRHGQMRLLAIQHARLLAIKYLVL